MSAYTEDEIHRAVCIGRLLDTRRKTEDDIETEVQCARREGMSWAKVGLALGTSGQAAWERYGLTDEQRRERITADARRFQQLSLELTAQLQEQSPENKRSRKQRRGAADR